jgi:protein SCO1/2
MGAAIWRLNSVIRSTDREASESLPTLDIVPQFMLPSESGRRVSLEQLRGSIWVANFFFTSCKSICPPMNTNLKRIQDVFRGDGRVQLVSFTVDPVTDTEEKLREYALAFGAISGKWHFITGEKKAIYALARQGFKVGVNEIPSGVEGSSQDFIHSDKLILVDRLGCIRGYYSGLDEQDVQRLIQDIRKLQGEQP